MRSLAVAAVLCLALAPSAFAKPCHAADGKFTKCPAAVSAPQCKKGVPCGNTCIAKGKICHKP